MPASGVVLGAPRGPVVRAMIGPPIKDRSPNGLFGNRTVSHSPWRAHSQQGDRHAPVARELLMRSARGRIERLSRNQQAAKGTKMTRYVPGCDYASVDANPEPDFAALHAAGYRVIGLRVAYYNGARIVGDVCFRRG
jgi:hypothetical protein